MEFEMREANYNQTSEWNFPGQEDMQRYWDYISNVYECHEYLHLLQIDSSVVSDSVFVRTILLELLGLINRSLRSYETNGLDQRVQVVTQTKKESKPLQTVKPFIFNYVTKPLLLRSNNL